MQIYYMLHRLIEKGLYEVEDMLQKLDVYFLTDTISEQEYNTLHDMVCPPMEDEVVEELPQEPEENHPVVTLPEVDEEVATPDSDIKE